MATVTESLRNSIGDTAEIARNWFEERALPKSREQFEARGQLEDAGSGAVYAYFDANGKALYVGMTKRRVKARLHDKTSPHKEKNWWKSWISMRFVQLPQDMDRQILEFLLIVAYSPQCNKKPKAIKLADLFGGYDLRGGSGSACAMSRYSKKILPAGDERITAVEACRSEVEKAMAKPGGE